MPTPGYNLYRSAENSDVIDYETVVGTASSDADVIATDPGVTHEASSFYWYGIRAVNVFGTQEQNTDRKVKVEFDADGHLVSSRPNKPFGLQARAVSVTSTQIAWRYDPTNEQAEPSKFFVYCDAVKIAEATYIRGQRGYSVVVSHGLDTDHTFRVRALTAVGMQDENESDVVLAYKSAPPAAPTIVTVETI